jgi:hypothetical protein
MAPAPLEAWIAGNGKKIEERLDKMRKGGRVMKHPVAWIPRGSDWWFAVVSGIGFRTLAKPIQTLTFDDQGGQASGGLRLVDLTLVQEDRFAGANRLIDTIRAAHFS